MKKRSASTRIYRRLLRLFPFDFQREFATEMEGVFRDEHRQATKGGIAKIIRLWWITLRGFLQTAPLSIWRFSGATSATDCAHFARVRPLPWARSQRSRSESARI